MWLGVDIDISGSFSLCSCLEKLSSKNYKWGGICLATIFWSIWKARYESVFSNTKIKFPDQDFLIKHRA